MAELQGLLSEGDAPCAPMTENRLRTSIVVLVTLSILFSGLCATAVVVITSNNADAGDTSRIEQASVSSHHYIDLKISSVLPDIRAIEMGPNESVHFANKPPIMAMHVELPELKDIRGRIEDRPIAIPAITVFKETMPRKRRLLRRAKTTPPVIVMRQKSLFEALFGVPFPL
ncbi:MAG: hypothetical protein Q7T55_20355 [Solirubrobacteraceae bacterium]|nr:hypothetical protein [Solirubrobacteraceae bacterium]